ncbi:hypothetical protein HaLaN_15824 [Haematococcus lacustris]|uniref:Uncharacterized protein n=1 Tax=Haematococcus lacustris TaxID=44745 RepID=A0A699ZB66_HAELA|nr:hypothetical protein HaLaN_15824 [Haematococcus lacustris]
MPADSQTPLPLLRTPVSSQLHMPCHSPQVWVARRRGNTQAHEHVCGLGGEPSYVTGCTRCAGPRPLLSLLRERGQRPGRSHTGPGPQLGTRSWSRQSAQGCACPKMWGRRQRRQWQQH